MFGKTDGTKELMRRIYEEMWNKANPAFAVELFERPDGVEKFVSQFLLSFPDLQHSVEEMIAEGEHVAARFTARGSHLGAWMNFPATGRSIQYTGVTWARIAGGRIIEHHTWWDKAGLIKQIGG
ncbi:MAG TPA: ester cyclase [Anaerolineales bacterium]|nr:ester cyclase [Anaerolineales bacterium]